MAKRVIGRIFELDDSHGGDYVILSNLCARAGRCELFEEIDERQGGGEGTWV